MENNNQIILIPKDTTPQQVETSIAAFNQPLANTDAKNISVMINVLGEEGHTGDAHYTGLENILEIFMKYFIHNQKYSSEITYNSAENKLKYSSEIIDNGTENNSEILFGNNIQ